MGTYSLNPFGHIECILDPTSIDETPYATGAISRKMSVKDGLNQM